jgi:regulator of cell morphogenesis and NO signaling
MEVRNEMTLNAEKTVEEIESAGLLTPAEETTDWNAVPLRQLLQHILDNHHAWLREQLPLIEQLLEKVVFLHDVRLLPLQRVFAHLQSELESHMRKEEKFLFPAILRMEEALAAGDPVPKSPFGSVRHPILMMEHDDGVVMRDLDDIRDITCGYDLRADACLNVRALYRELQALEADLGTHIQLENNILFPRSASLERQGRVLH